VHEVDDGPRHPPVGVRQDAVAEVEDVAGPPADAVEDVLRPPQRELLARQQRHGSRLPWIARSSPISFHASSMGRRQSTLTASPPARATSGSSAGLPLKKLMLGTPAASKRSKIVRMCGNTNSS
jgi:hypothetical protein